MPVLGCLVVEIYEQSTKGHILCISGIFVPRKRWHGSINVVPGLASCPSRYQVHHNKGSGMYILSYGTRSRLRSGNGLAMDIRICKIVETHFYFSTRAKTIPKDPKGVVQALKVRLLLVKPTMFDFFLSGMIF